MFLIVVSLQPEVIGTLTRLKELWIDCNQVQNLPSVSCFLSYILFIYILNLAVLGVSNPINCGMPLVKNLSLCLLFMTNIYK